MVAGKRVLALIPARGGSKGIPGKNLVELGGKPLLAWSIETALACSGIDRVVLSSDDASIMACGRAYGCDVPFVRPAALSTDAAPAADAIMHALESLEEAYDYLVILQPTSPFRRVEDVEACLALSIKQGAPVVSVMEPRHPPQWMFSLGETGEMQPLLSGEIPYQRQKVRPYYALNGAVYVAEVAYFREHRSFLGERTLAHLMPAAFSVDIDTPDDLICARARLHALPG
ncbi:acylneuraminate cytidylyltransferase [Magnetococcus marinus MC-1]|uniref:Acylneuraminate cytidylyltransferase n=1 Tax=Magnetococcus marinus (strain ATCC BAA-1437 / JCM 17883 / MC-1) TaxID=156889 RepID=A0L541_MAGMM|nr:acylneuraminate cytidylyltransferase family protein [Magnetococcus marinus]ABK43084.1 acylneuraminate cytidylyltransferase [Magnetococcus marinus MC-1]